ncbi:transposase [Bradyrhizobium roseum]|uniref:transposase n=1 Tax=Bradyrhizobium roseum TaxID=3056648 RepID=UPI002606E655|nr:transposase [Bradyrhizobium roseus]WKA29968.1 transposase [Bradyrhizobium roseus]
MAGWLHVAKSVQEAWMRRSRFTESEILHLLYEASAGVPIAEICDTAGVSLRTFYRWKRSFGGLSTADVPKIKELEFENARLRGLVRNLTERLRQEQEARKAAPVHDKERERRRAIGIAAEKCGGAVTGRFASVRVNP